MNAHDAKILENKNRREMTVECRSRAYSAPSPQPFDSVLIAVDSQCSTSNITTGNYWPDVLVTTATAGNHGISN
jgi:hypothetical protein